MREQPIPINPEQWDIGCIADEVRNNFVIPTIKRFIVKHAVQRVIDVGCGTGYVSRVLAGEDDLSHIEWTLLDRSPEMLRYAATRFPANGHATFSSNYAEAYAATEDAPAHDLCICVYTLLEVENLAEFVAALKRCAPRGAILVFVPDAVPDIIEYYVGLDDHEFVTPLVGRLSHPLEKVDGFTGRTQTFLARQGIDYVMALVDNSTTLRDVSSYTTARGGRHFYFAFAHVGR